MHWDSVGHLIFSAESLSLYTLNLWKDLQIQFMNINEQHCFLNCCIYLPILSKFVKIGIGAKRVQMMEQIKLEVTQIFLKNVHLHIALQ